LDSEVLIIGAGIIGLSSALGLLQRGVKVTLLERGATGAESSWAGGGILSPLCPWDYSDAVTRLTTRGAALFPAWAESLHAATGIDPEYEVSGMLILPPCDELAAQQWCTVHGVKLERAKDALLMPDVAQVRNPRLVQALRQQVEALGGRIVEQCVVHELLTEQGQITALATSAGAFSAQSYIVTAGAWSKEVLGQHALQLDIKPMRGQMLLFKFPRPPLPHIVLQGDMYMIPRRDGHLLVGSTLEDVGFDKSTTQTAAADLRQRAAVVLPQLRDMPLVQQWAGLRPASPHNIPTIGRHPHLENLYINSGHFRYGVTMAPASAEILLHEMTPQHELTNSPQLLDASPYQAGWGHPLR
jgi:glycine oxidase